jgi:hypothetical protein
MHRKPVFSASPIRLDSTKGTLRWPGLCVLLSFAQLWSPALAQQLCKQVMPANAAIRPEVKEFIDQIRSYTLTASFHTTDSLEPLEPKPSKIKPADPRAFPAGRYKILFERKGDTKAIWVNVEEHVGHFVTVIPGATKVDGSVQLSSTPSVEVPNGITINNDEIDYLIVMTYRSFCVSLHRETAAKLNRFKDMLLATRFQTALDVQAYHRRLVGDLK